MIKDLIQSLRDSLDERISNPLPAAFLIAWCIHNWQIVAELFGFGNDPTQRIQAIRSAATNWDFIWAPLFLALAYVIVMPWLAFLMQLYHQIANNYRKTSKLAAESKLNKTRLEVANQRSQLESTAFSRSEQIGLLTRKHQYELNEANNQISSLNDELNSDKRAHDQALDSLRRQLKNFENTKDFSNAQLQEKYAKQVELQNQTTNESNSLRKKLADQSLKVQEQKKEIGELRRENQELRKQNKT